MKMLHKPSNYKTYKLSNVDLDIPASHIIWTVQFDGLEGINGSQAALILSGDSIDTPADFKGTGSSYDDFWQTIFLTSTRILTVFWFFLFISNSSFLSQK